MKIGEEFWAIADPNDIIIPFTFGCETETQSRKALVKWMGKAWKVLQQAGYRAVCVKLTEVEK